MKKKNLALFYVFMLLMVAIDTFLIVQACLTGEVSSDVSKGPIEITADIINFVFPNAINDSNYSLFSGVIRKLYGHFGLFAISGLFSTFAICYLSTLHIFKSLEKKSIITIVTITKGYALACLTELLQLTVDGRSGEFLDTIIDLSGYLVGGFFATIIILNTIIKKYKKDKEIKKQN